MALMKFNSPSTHDRRFSDIMDEFFNEAIATRRRTFVPSIDVSETDNQYQIDVEIPGMNKDDINLNVENNMLTISGERTFEQEEDGKQYHKKENRYGSFSRSFRLPENIDSESVDANYENGLLHITVDKSEEKVKKKIEIK